MTTSHYFNRVTSMRWPTTLRLFAATLCVCVLTQPAFGQEEAAEQDPEQAVEQDAEEAREQDADEAGEQETEQPASAPAPVIAPISAEQREAFEPLIRKFENLRSSLNAMRGIRENDLPVIRAIRDEFTSYNEQWPGHRRALAIELQLAMWLDEEAGIEALYEQVIAFADEPGEMRLGWAKFHKRQNEYERAIEIIEAGAYDYADAPEAALLLSECLFAENRFDEALVAIDAVTEDAIATDFLIKRRVDDQRPDREAYVDFWVAEQEALSEDLAAGDLPQVELNLEGNRRIVLELFEDDAPNTVENFISLVDDGFYDGTRFHQVIVNSMSQGGDPNSKDGEEGIPGQGGPGYRILDEFSMDGARLHFTGSLSMANTGLPNSGGSRFFITHEPQPSLNGKRTVFGRVIEGLDVARSIEEDDLLVNAVVLRKRDHEYIPETLSELPGAPTLPDGINLQPTLPDRP